MCTIRNYKHHNLSHENCSRAFDTLIEIVNDLKELPELWTIVSQEDIKCLSKAINIGKVYIKNIYRFQIKKHSKVKKSYEILWQKWIIGENIQEILRLIWRWRFIGFFASQKAMGNSTYDSNIIWRSWKYIYFFPKFQGRRSKIKPTTPISIPS